jgi:hypothetical protein
MRELATIWQQAAQRWPGDRRLRELGDRLHDTTAVRAALHE